MLLCSQIKPALSFVYITTQWGGVNGWRNINVVHKGLSERWGVLDYTGRPHQWETKELVGLGPWGIYPVGHSKSIRDKKRTLEPNS